MDKKDAKKLLVEHSKALNVLLNNEGVSEKTVDADGTLGSIEEREEHLSFIQKIIKKAQQVPVVETFSNLGVAGSVAVTSAAVTQTEIAKDVTEVFVAEVANDVVERRIEVPQFVDNFVDFHEINTWGEQVIAEKFVEAQSVAANVSVEIQNKIETGEIEVAKPKTSASESDKKTLEPDNKEEQKQESEEEAEQDKPLEEEVKETSDEEEAKSDKQEKPLEQKTEEKKESQEKSSSEDEEGEEEVKPNSDTEEETEQPTEDSRANSDSILQVETPNEDTTIVSPTN